MLKFEFHVCQGFLVCLFLCFFLGGGGWLFPLSLGHFEASDGQALRFREGEVIRGIGRSFQGELELKLELLGSSSHRCLSAAFCSRLWLGFLE